MADKVSLAAEFIEQNADWVKNDKHNFINWATHCEQWKKWNPFNYTDFLHITNILFSDVNQDHNRYEINRTKFRFQNYKYTPVSCNNVYFLQSKKRNLLVIF